MDPDLPPPPSSSSSSSSSKVNDPFLARAQKFGLKTDVNVSDLPPAPTGYQGRTTTSNKPDAKSLVAQIKSSASASAALIAANPKLAGGPPPAGGKSPVVTSTCTSSSPKIEPLNGTSAVVKANPFARASHTATTSPFKSSSPVYTSSTPSKSITSAMASSSLHDDDDDDPPPAAPDDDDDDQQTSPRGLTGLGMAKGGVTAGSTDIKPFAYAGNSIKGVVLKKTNRDIYDKPVSETRNATIQTSSGAKNISKFTTKTAAESEASPIPESHRAKDPLYSTPLPIDKTTGGALFSWREAAPAKQALGTCDKCGEEIMDRMLDALGQTFHAECFVCVVCRKTLAGDVLTVNDNYYHPSCMTCTICSTQLSSQQFTVHPDTQELYCVKHARQAVASPGAGPDGRIQCGFCHESILPGQEIVKELTGQTYHANCMNCAHCKAPLAGRRCFTHNGKQYCEVDYNDLFQTSCHHCMKVIEGSCMQIEDEMMKKYTFHPGCFVCHQCRTNLRGQSFYVDRGRVLCEKDYTEISDQS